MNKDLNAVSNHMVSLALGALTHANWHACYISDYNRYWSELSILQAAHAAELLIKAKIAEEHPLLIFEQLPKIGKAISSLELEHLFEKGRTVQFSELPDRLWATTGIVLENLELYREFGKLRNKIQHFASPPNVDCSSKTIEFIYGVIDPFIHSSWGLYAVDFNEDHEPYEYFIPTIIAHEVRFKVSKECARDFENMRIDWTKTSPDYEKEMKRRFGDALTL